MFHYNQMKSLEPVKNENDSKLTASEPIPVNCLTFDGSELYPLGYWIYLLVFT